MSTNVPVPAGTTLGKSFEYGMDVNLGTYASPIWQAIRRMSGYAPTFPKTTEDVATYDDLGAPNEDVTGRGFAAAFTVQANRALSTGLYLPEVQAIIAASRTKGESAVLDVRFYHKPEFGTPNPTDAGRAFVTVEVSRQNTGNSQNEILSVNLVGKGNYEPIANPFAGWGTTIPVITAIEQEAAGDGDIFTIIGTGFLGATAVSVDGTPLVDGTFEVLNGATIVAIMPAGDAGSVPIIVTTPAGPSAAFAYTRGS